MQIIIDIPEDVYKRTVFYREFKELNDLITTIKALENGISLPKVHGRLIDEMELGDIIARMWKNKQITNTKYNTFLNILDYVPTVIERDGD